MADEWMGALHRFAESKAGLALFTVWLIALTATLIW